MHPPQAHVSDDEFVLRRVPEQYAVPPLSNPPVGHNAFRPTEKDVTGISVYRAIYHPDPKTILAGIPDEVKRAKYTIVKLAVADIESLGLSVVPKEDEIAGHAEIPQLNRTAREDNKQWANEIQLELAKKSIIVHSPLQPA